MSWMVLIKENIKTEKIGYKFENINYLKAG